MNPRRSILGMALPCLAVFAVLAQVAAFAEDPPLPDALLNAKTAFLQNNGASGKEFDRFRKAFQKWGRFTIVQDLNSADVLILLQARSNTRGPSGPGPDPIGKVKPFPTMTGHLGGDSTIRETLDTEDPSLMDPNDMEPFGTQPPRPFPRENMGLSDTGPPTSVRIDYFIVIGDRRGILYRNSTTQNRGQTNSDALVSALKKRMGDK